MSAAAAGTEVSLPRPPGVIRRALAAHPVAVDAVIMAGYLFGAALGIVIDIAITASAEVVSVDGLALPEYLAWPWWPIAILRVAAIAISLLLRRRYPLQGLVVVVIAGLGDHGVQGLATGVALLFMIYAVPVYRSVSAGWIGYVVAVFGSVVSMLFEVGATFGPAGVLIAGNDDRPGAVDIIGLAVMTGVWYLAVLMLGINLGNRRRYVAAIIERAHQLARERDQLAQLAVAEERSRIAREMHDIVAHSVSVMIALSEGAARAAAAAPEAAAEAMARSAETGRTALAEMRRMLGALQDSGEQRPELVPQPGVDDLPELVQSFRDAGMLVELTVAGEASGDRGQDLAVYRVVQEGLTNALRYAGSGARVEVEVQRKPERTEVTVTDHGSLAGVSAAVTGLGSGRGIAGLRERARMFGGRLEAGPHGGAAAGWRLRAELPVGASARTEQGE